jgi:hypothetical protein
MHKLRLLSISAVVAGLVLGAGALGMQTDRAQAAPEDDITATFEAAVAAWNAQDAEAFADLFTDAGLLNAFDLTRDELDVLEEEMASTGPIANATISDIFATSGQATAIVDIQFEQGFSIFEEWGFLFDFTAGGWLINHSETASRPIPEGVPAVQMLLDEYSFNYNAAAIQAADGNFAFQVSNVGEEEHEIVLFEITTSAPLGDVVDAIAESGEDEQPEGVGAIEFLGFFTPGTDGTAIPSAPLAQGRYGLICFIPAADGTPHAFLGMVSEFTVGQEAGGGSTPITPPSTGDAGLLGASDGTATWLMLGVALVLLSGGAAGFIVSRGRA